MTDTKLIAFFQLNDRLHVSESTRKNKKKKKKQHSSNAHSVQGEQAQ
jgi:hypothetical protein